MCALERKATELHGLVQDMLYQFRLVEAASANGPHADLSMQELRVVEYLGDEGAHRMGELAEFLLLAVNSVTTLVDNLEKKQLVRRQRSEEDRRIVLVELTEAGQKIYAAAFQEKLLLLRNMLSGLTDEEQDIFMVLFRKIARSGRSQAAKLAPSA